MRFALRLIPQVGLFAWLALILSVLSVLLYIETVSYYWLVLLPIPVLIPPAILGRFINVRPYIIMAVLGVSALILVRVVLDLWLPLR